MLRRFLLLTFIGSVILAAMLTISPKAARASGSTPELAVVAAVSNKDVWTAGEVLTSANNEAIVEHWDGHRWQISPGATPAGALASGLFGITALSRDNVWAVGSIAVQAVGSQPLIEHWNGSEWQFIPNPVLATHSGYLTGVSAVSAHDVWAVGEYEDSNFAQLPLIEHWDGSSWSVVASPNLGSFTSLNAVAATSAHDVWAVGSFFDSMNTTQALVEHWDGLRWEATIGLNPAGSPSSFLNGVTAISHNDVWAVGATDQPGSGGGVATLIEHWNGSSWQIVSSPNFPGVNGTSNMLNGMAAVPHDEDVWTVGRAINQTGSFLTLVEAWNGTKWRIVPSPNP